MCCGMLRHASIPPPTGPKTGAAACCGMLQPLVTFVFIPPPCGFVMANLLLLTKLQWNVLP